MWYEGILQNHFITQWKWKWGRLFQSHQETDEVKNLPDATDEDNILDENDNETSKYAQSKNNQGLSQQKFKKFKSLLKDVNSLTGITRIPSDIVSARAGKMKASKWK
ncbi:hypothetical protein O181_011754 [Austropuccinia psidii MF-1]|uniref:Uncharacterized protein n=1 Tax=Austropuccinia psidii MF-1 TaxID=1389203 RepID=A0A9Q3BV26_9BASI|nr:hypothetical protein [Austropuccinia psidii MF-1]